MAEFCILKMNQKNKMINNIYKAYKGTGDRKDTIHSITRFYKKNAGPSAFTEVAVAAPVNLDDSFTTMVKTLCFKGEIDQRELAFCVERHQAKDKKFAGAYKCLKQSNDRKDFINTV